MLERAKRASATERYNCIFMTITTDITVIMTIIGIFVTTLKCIVHHHFTNIHFINMRERASASEILYFYYDCQSLFHNNS